MQKTKFTIFLAIISLGFFGVVGVASAAEYYVAPTGVAVWANCGGPTPLNGESACSPQTAMTNAVAGDIVYFRGGDYYPPDYTSDPYISWKPSNGGTVGNPITFTVYPNEIANIYQPTVSRSAAAMGVARKSNYQNNSYIIFDGFTFHKRRHMSAGGVWKCELASNITVKNNTFIGNDPWQITSITGISNSLTRAGYSRVTITDPINSVAASSSNKIFVTISGTANYNGSWFDFQSGNGLVYYVDEYNFDIQRAFVSSETGTAIISDAQNQVGLYNTDCTDLEIYNNIFRDFGYSNATLYGTVNSGAMWLLGGLRTVVHNNTFLNMPNAIQTKGSANGITSYNNFFNNVKGPFNWVQQWTGIKDFFIYNNVAILPSGGTFVYGAGAVPWANNLVYNNTIYCQGACNGVYQFAANMLELESFNNIIYGAGGTTTFVKYDIGAGTPVYSNYNNYYTGGTANWAMAISPGAYSTNIYTSLGAWRTATGFDNNSITTNPGFVNLGGTTAVDYKRTSYLANGRGGSYASVMGAYITGSEIIGYVAPSSPPPLKGDFNSDSKVNNLDFTSFKNAFKSLFNAIFDLNSDSAIDVKDLGVLMSGWLP